MNIYSSCRNEVTFIKDMLNKIAVNPIFANLYVNSINKYRNFIAKYSTKDDFVSYSRVGSTANDHIINSILDSTAKVLSAPTSEMPLQKKKFLLVKVKNDYNSYLDRIVNNYERGVRYVS